MGPRDTEAFLRSLGDKVGLDENKLRASLEPVVKEAQQFFNYVGVGLYMGLTDSYSSVVAESNIAIGLTRFLTNDCGLLPSLVIVTGSPPDEYRDSIKQRLTEDLGSSVKPGMFFEVDAYKTEKYKTEKILDKYPSTVILGSSMEKYLSESKYLALHLSVSFPAFDRLIMRRSYFGFFGGINLLEDLLTKTARPF